MLKLLKPQVSRVKRLQAEVSANNSSIWALEEDSYAAWLRRFGPVSQAAARIAADPAARLAPLDRHLAGIAAAGGSVVNLMGSHGSKAVALALLGARATVVDVSPGNARYARELAAAAGVRVEYVLADVLALPKEVAQPVHDAILLEMVRWPACFQAYYLDGLLYPVIPSAVEVCDV